MAPWSANLANAKQFFRFYGGAVSRYDLHSPFLASWYEEVYADQRYYYAFDTAAQLRQYWVQQNETVQAMAMGAPSRVNTNPIRTTAELARYGSISPTNGRFLFRLCQWLRPKTILEMGTNLGLSTIFLRAGAATAQLVSMEGNPQLVRLAQRSFDLCQAKDIQLIPGAFTDTLESSLAAFDQLDLLFLDGDHRGSATEAYIAQCLEKAGPGSCLIIDDIHWSEDMNRSWEKIRHSGIFNISIDLFQMGLLFIRPEVKEPIHLSIVPYAWKPWRMGFW